MLNKLFITLLSFILVGCMSFSSTEDEQPLELGDRTVNYKSGDNVISLTVPPDLTKPKITDVVPLPDSDNPESNKILVTPTDISVIRKGQRRWLEVNKTPEDMWNIAKDFFKEYGFAIDKSNKKIGLIETDSLPRDNKIPDQALGTIRTMLQSALKTKYALPIVDKYRIRIEPIENGERSEVYLSVTSMEEVVKNEGARNETIVWQSHPKDYELEAEMLYRFMIFIGSDETKAKEKFLQAKEQQSVQVELSSAVDGYAKLVFPLAENETWKNVGWALDELNVDIEDKDSQERSYYISIAKTEDKGFFSNIFGEDAIKKTFQILVRRAGDNVTEVLFNDLSEENEQGTIDFSHEFLGNIANLF